MKVEEIIDELHEIVTRQEGRIIQLEKYQIDHEKRLLVLENIVHRARQIVDWDQLREDWRTMSFKKAEVSE